MLLSHKNCCQLSKKFALQKITFELRKKDQKIRAKMNSTIYTWEYRIIVSCFHTNVLSVFSYLQTILGDDIGLYSVVLNSRQLSRESATV